MIHISNQFMFIYYNALYHKHKYICKYTQIIYKTFNNNFSTNRFRVKMNIVYMYLLYVYIYIFEINLLIYHNVYIM